MNAINKIETESFSNKFPPAQPSSKRSVRMLVTEKNRDGSRGIHHSFLNDLPKFLRSGDLLVINKSGTLPARLTIPRYFRDGFGSEFGDLELRLLSRLDERNIGTPGDSGRDVKGQQWLAVAYDGGSWRQDTHSRRLLDTLPRNSAVLGSTKNNGLKIKFMSKISRGLFKVALESLGEGSVSALVFKFGRPIQYSYLDRELFDWDVQTIFSTTPMSVEPPSAGLHFNWQLISKLKSIGVNLAYITHSAGVSSTGVEELDNRLPLNETSCIPADVVKMIQEAKSAGGRVIGVGTSVVRALEGRGDILLKPELGCQLNDLLLGPDSTLKVVDGIISGLHEVETSHFRLLQAFTTTESLFESYRQAMELDYFQHEFGDVHLIV